MKFFPDLISVPLSSKGSEHSPRELSESSPVILRQSKADVFQSVADEVLFQVNSSGEWTYLDENWEVLSGFSSHLCTGQLFLDYFDLAERSKLISQFQETISGRRSSFRQPIRLLRLNDIPIDVEIVACRLLGADRLPIGITGTIQIQDSANREREIGVESQNDLSQLLQSLPVAVGILEIDGKGISYRFTNPAAETILKKYFKGWPPLSSTFPEISPTQDYLSLLQQKCDYSQNSGLCIQFEYQCAVGGQTICLLHTVAPLSLHNVGPLQFSCAIEDVSGDREKLRHIAASESRYRSVLEALTEYVHCCSPDYLFTFVNKAYCNFRKLNAEQLLGSGIFDDVSPKDRAEVRKHFESLSQDNPIAIGENRTISPGGQVRWHQWIDRAIFNDRGELVEIQSVGRDITQRKMAEETLRVLNQELGKRTQELQQALRFEDILKRIIDKVRDSLDEENILNVVVKELCEALDLKLCTTVLYCSGDNSDNLTYQYSSEQQFQEKDFDIPDLSRILTQVREGNSVCFCWSGNSLGYASENLKNLAFVCPIIDDSRVLGSLLVVTKDVSSYQKAELNLFEQISTHCAIAIRQARLYQEAQTQVRELERLNVLKDDFLSTVSHELRTPITSMKMAIRMLRVSQSREKQTQYLNTLESECAREAALVNDLLDLQRLQSGVSPLTPSEIKLQAWIPYLTQSFIPRIQQRNQELIVDIDLSLTAIQTDEPSLHRVLAELLNNACKYTPDGGTIELSVMASNCRKDLIFYVRNREAEIPEDEIGRIFEKFYRIPSGDRWKQGGTGLGLALVSQLVEHLGGRIQVTSQSKQVTFIIQIPNL